MLKFEQISQGAANLRRRHLDESQRAMVAAKLATLQKGANQHAQIKAPSQGVATAMLNISRDSVQKARKVLERAAPEVRAVVALVAIAGEP